MPDARLDIPLELHERLSGLASELDLTVVQLLQRLADDEFIRQFVAYLDASQQPREPGLYDELLAQRAQDGTLEKELSRMRPPEESDGGEAPS